MATLVRPGSTVIQLILVLAAEGLAGALGLGLFTLVVTPLIFFYLTRPHVAAAFGRRRRSTGPS